MNFKSFKKSLYPISLLIIPLFAKIFSRDFKWNFFDFLVMGILLFVVGFSIEFIRINVQKKKIKFLLLLFVVLSFLLLWIELAVGVFNSPFAGN